MRLQIYTDVAAFKDAALPFLRAQALPMSQLRVMVECLTQARVDEQQGFMACLYVRDQVAALALCISSLPLRHLLVSDWPMAGLSLLEPKLRSLGLQQVIGPLSSAQACAQILGPARLNTALHNYALQTTPTPLSASGSARACGPDDIEHLLAWFTAFEVEARMAPRPPAVLRQGFIEDMRPGSNRQAYFWMDGAQVVAMAGMVMAAGLARIGPVYTPPEHRRHGYAGALVSHLASRAIAAGVDGVCLFADAANPTSNGLYQRLGFVHLNDFAHYDCL